MSVFYGHLIIFFNPKTDDSLRYCPDSRSVSTKFNTNWNRDKDEEHPIRLFSPNISKILPKTSKTFHSQSSKRFLSFSERVFGEHIRRTARASEKNVVKYRRKKSFRRKRTYVHKRRTHLSSTRGVQLISLF